MIYSGISCPKRGFRCFYVLFGLLLGFGIYVQNGACGTKYMIEEYERGFAGFNVLHNIYRIN